MAAGSLRFAAVGDITLGDHPLCVGFGAYSHFMGKETLFPFQKIRQTLQRADLLFGNLECTHSPVGMKRHQLASMQMRGDPRHIEALARVGFKVVNVANNHAAQHGVTPFFDTVNRLHAHNIACCGLAADGDATRTQSVTLIINGIAVGFLGYSLRPRQYFDHVPPYAEGKIRSIIHDVHVLRDRVHIVVVSLHWGEEFILRPSPEEVQMARHLVDEGVHLVIGHHPHVVRPVERYGKGWIVYSLGNFICDMIWDETLRTGLIFECTMTEHGIKDVNLVMTYINDDYQPEVLDLEKAQSLWQQVVVEEPHNGSIEDMEGATRLYLQDADHIHRLIRAKSHRFFLSRCWKSPMPILVQQFLTYVKNRVHERVASSGC